MTQTDLPAVETQKPDLEPGPVAVAGAQLDPIRHTHLCPICHDDVECKDFCATELGLDEQLTGVPWVCDDCKNSPADSIDIITGKVEVGDILRCDEDNLVYEVDDIDLHELRATLTTIIGYPKGRRRMNLAKDGSPERRSMADGSRLPLWFRVTK